MIQITYVVDCHCGEQAQMSILHTDQPEDDGRIVHDFQMIAEQCTLYCEACQCVTYTGDLDVSCEDEEECDGPEFSDSDDSGELSEDDRGQDGSAEDGRTEDGHGDDQPQRNSSTVTSAPSPSAAS